MGKIIIQGSSGGGLDPDEISARASDVLKGKTTIDSDGEVVEGGIDDRGSYAECKDIAVGSHDMNLYFLGGYYKHRTDGTRPTLVVEFEQLRNKLGIDVSKMLEGYSLLGVSGSIPFRGHGLIDDKKASGNFNIVNNYADIDIQNIPEGYYKKDSSYSWSPAVRVPLQKLLDYLGIDTSKMLDTLTVGNRRGSIPVRGGGHIATNSYLWGESDTKKWFVSWMPSGYYHEMNNTDRRGFSEILTNMDDVYRVLNLRPDVIRAGHTVGFMTGTMPDYSSGRVVFNGATFDGVLVSGVADKSTNKNGATCIQPRGWDFEFAGAYPIGSSFGKYVNREYRILGIQDGGLKVFVRKLGGGDEHSWLKASYIMKNSINLTPFRQIKVGYKIRNPMSGDLSRNRECLIKVSLAIASTYGSPGGRYAVEINSFSSEHGAVNERNHNFRDRYNIDVGNDTQQYIYLDVRGNNGHYYFMVGASADVIQNTRAEVIFNHIEFIN